MTAAAIFLRVSPNANHAKEPGSCAFLTACRDEASAGDEVPCEGPGIIMLSKEKMETLAYE